MSSKLHVEHRAAAAPAVANSPQLPLVMLHGWGMNLRAFDGLRDELAVFESSAIDLPGHGRSPWWPEAADFEAQCEAVLEALPPRCVLAGWSFGAKIALALAARHAARVAALILLGPTPKFAQAPDWPHGMDTAALCAFRTVLEQDWRQTLDDFLWLQLRGSREAEASVQALRATLLEHGAPQPEALQPGLQLLHTIDLRALVPQVKQPVLLVAGRNDRVTLPGAAQWLAAQWPAARLLELPRAGHAPLISHRTEVAGAIREFLATLPVESA